MFDISDIGLNLIRKIQDVWRGARSDSLIDYTRPMRVEPIVVVDSSILFTKGMDDLMQSLNSMWAGLYLQAVALSTTIGKIEVHRHLDRLNPSRKPLDSAADAAGWILAQESYSHGLPTVARRAALEDYMGKDDVRLHQTSSGFGRDTAKELKEVTDLSVGKMLMVEITDGLHTGTIPVSVRLRVSSYTPEGIVHILDNQNRNTGTVERYHAWRSGELESIRDMVFCRDLIDAHRKKLMADREQLLAKMLARRRSNQLSAIVSANPSLATVSNIIVVSNTTIKELEKSIDGRFRDFKTREQLLEGTTVMMVCVVDPGLERVTIYSQGIPDSTEVSMSSLKSSSKNGPDVSDILKAYQVGSSPSL